MSLSVERAFTHRHGKRFRVTLFLEIRPSSVTRMLCEGGYRDSEWEAWKWRVLWAIAHCLQACVNSFIDFSGSLIWEHVHTWPASAPRSVESHKTHKNKTKAHRVLCSTLLYNHRFLYTHTGELHSSLYSMCFSVDVSFIWLSVTAQTAITTLSQSQDS